MLEALYELLKSYYVVIEKYKKIERGMHMQNIESKSKLVAEIVTVLGIQFIMMVFRLVEPIHWPSLFPGKYTTFLNEFAYLGIEFGLVIVIVAHFIFGRSFKEMGLHKIKENIGTLLLNLLFLGVSIAVAYFMSLFSKNVEIHWIELICQINTNFIAIAFLREVIFRGFLFRSFYELTNGKGILASLITAIFFVLTSIPSILITLNDFTLNALLQGLVIPFAMGVYLSLLYYYTRNLWTGIILHGVFISLLTLEQDFAVCTMEIIYAAILVIYLIVKIVHYYRGDEELDEEDEALETPEIEETVTDTDEEAALEEIANETSESKEQVTNKEILSEQIITNNQKISNVEETITVSIPHFTKEKEKVAYEPEQIPKDMLTALDNLHEELKQKAKAPIEEIDFDRTLIMPALPDDPVKLQELVEAQEKEKTPDLMSILSTEIEEDGDIEIPLELNHAEPNYIAHLEKYLGEFEAIYKQMIPTNPPIDILYFKGEKANALVTNGMRGLPMNVPPELKDYQNIELMMYVDKQFDLSSEGLAQSKNGWLTKLLAEMATYPGVTNSYLGWGHIVGNGDKLEPYDESIKYCGAMVYPSIHETDVNFSRYRENGVNVFLYNVMPLYKEELKFIQEHSSEQFVNLMASMGVNQMILPKRMNVVSHMKHQ